jgi:hypothetical protein
MDRKVTAALEKLSKSVSAIAECMTQLQMDIAKIGARVVAIDTEIASIGRHLGREKNGSGEDENRRDLELEREVFGHMSKRPIPEIREKAADKTGRKSSKSGAAKRAAKLTAKRKR